MSMSQYKCDICGKEYKRKENLIWHTNNQVCVGKKYEDIDDGNRCKCTYCHKSFTTLTSMYRHMKHTCKIKKNDDLNRDQIYERLVELEKKSEKIDVLEKENKLLKKEVLSLKKYRK